MKNINVIFLFLSFLNPRSDKQHLNFTYLPQEVVTNYNGIYEYEKSKDHYILIDTLNGNYSGIFFGTQNYSDQGVLFYGNTMENLNIKGDQITLNIGERNLYKTTQMKIVKNKDQHKNDPIIGIAKNRLKFNGEISKNRIKIKCISEFGDCLNKEMYFKKVAGSK